MEDERGKIKGNWKGMGGGLIRLAFNPIVLFVGSLSTLLTAIVIDEIKADKQETENAGIMATLSGSSSEQELYNFTSSSIIRIDRKIGDDDDDIKTTIYDFHERVVIIDGPGSADRVIQFSEFTHKPAIDDAFDAGCNIGKNAPDLLSAFQEKYGREYPESESLISYSAQFYQKHCLTAG